MYDLVNDLPDLPEHSNEIYYTVASGKLKTRVTGKYGLYPYDKWQKELLRAVDGDNFYNVFRACAKSNIKKTSMEEGRPHQSGTTICSSYVEGLAFYAVLYGGGIC